MPEPVVLNAAAFAVWNTVKTYGPIELGDVVSRTGIHQSQVAATATEGAKRGFFEIVEREREELTVSNDAKDLIVQGLPEVRAAARLDETADGSMPMSEFIAWAKKFDIAVNDVFKWGGARGWIERMKSATGPVVALKVRGKAWHESPDDDLVALRLLEYRGQIYLDDFEDELRANGVDAARVKSLLAGRTELARIRKRTQRILSLTSEGQKVQPEPFEESNTITPEDLESGAALDIVYRPYDVTLPADTIYPAKIHPLRKIIEQTRRAFLEMGFAEVASPMIESAFWNFDALFQPQDHPARDMQDTFYMRHPAEAPLPGHKGDGSLFPERAAETNASLTKKKTPVPFCDVVEHVRRTHEDGWETGSEGWGYTWSPERSRQVVLRTHTTAATIRALAANPNPPGKFFCVGWTYRNETISFKHLPVFHQVDGIVVDEEANLASLMGTLQEFYSKMGFGRVKFKPAFYPYTEPSVDVVVYMESRGKWLEMGGAGIFRPEVTLPLGCKYPVLAWGLGIERLAMLRFGFSDIRELYASRLETLDEVPLCR